MSGKPGKFVKRYTPPRSKEGPPAIFENAVEVNVIPKSKPAYHVPIETSQVYHILQTGKPIQQKLVDRIKENRKQFEKKAREMGINIDSPAHVCQAGCAIAAACGLAQKKTIFTEEASQKETQPSLIINMDGLDKKEAPTQKENKQKPQPELKIRYIKEASTVPFDILLPVKEKAAALKQDIKTMESHNNKVDKTPIRIPEQKVKTEIPVKPVKIVNKKEQTGEKANNIESNIPGELPQNIIKKFRQRRHLTETSETKQKKPPQTERRVLETFKKKVNEFFKQEAPSIKPFLTLSKRGFYRIFDRLIHNKSAKIEPPASKKEKSPGKKIDFSKPLRLGFLTLIPITMVDRKQKIRTRFRLVNLFKADRPERIKTINKKGRFVGKYKTSADLPEVAFPSKFRRAKMESGSVYKTEQKQIKKTATETLVEQIRTVLSKEKKLPFALIIMPTSMEKSNQGHKNETTSHEIVPITEKEFFKLINLSTKIIKGVDLLMVKENKKLFERIITLKLEDILSAPEEIQTVLKNQVNNMQLVLWYITKVLSSINRLNFYLTAP